MSLHQKSAFYVKGLKGWINAKIKKEGITTSKFIQLLFKVNQVTYTKKCDARMDKQTKTNMPLKHASLF